jgi:DNA-binding NarL/FixJ family response regulator
MEIITDATILAIDDELPNLILIEEFLTPFCKEIITEQDVEKALLLAKKKQPDIILLDIRMREMDGYEVCKLLKADGSTAHIPVIFLSSLLTTEDKVKGFEAGGVDYICKPFEIEEMLARIECCLKLHRQIYQTQVQMVKNVQKTVESYHLTEREVEILTLYARGKSRCEIAGKLNISDETAKFHLKNIFLKLSLENKVQAVHKAREIGLID